MLQSKAVVTLLNELIIGLSIGTAFLALVSMLIIMKLRRFETDKLKGILSLVVIGIAFYFMLEVTDIMNYFNMFGSAYNLSYYAGILNTIASIVISPLIAIFFLAAVFILRDS